MLDFLDLHSSVNNATTTWNYDLVLPPNTVMAAARNVPILPNTAFLSGLGASFTNELYPSLTSFASSGYSATTPA